MPDKKLEPPEKPKLTPANENPWYCLMTLHGEQECEGEHWEHNDALFERNRHDWNRWAAGELSEEKRKALRGMKNADGRPHFAPEELEPLDEDELSKLTVAFAKRRKNGSAGDISLPSGPVNCLNVLFERPVVLKGYLFPFFTEFSGATFSGSADLSHATFIGTVGFSNATFSGGAYFDGATFEREADFSSATFKDQAFFSDVTCEDVVNFSDTTFNHSTIFTNAQFKTFPPNFHEATLHSDTDWVGAIWPAPPEKLTKAKAHVRYYQRLKQVMDTLKKHEDELDFFAREMRAQRVVDRLTGHRGRAVMNWFYELTSDYGRKVGLPLAWLAGVVLLASIGLATTQECPLTDKLCPSSATWTPLGIGKALGLALTSAVGFLPFKKEIFGEIGASLSPAAHVIMSVEAILCAALLFLAGLGLRNRFRMK